MDDEEHYHSPSVSSYTPEMHLTYIIGIWIHQFKHSPSTCRYTSEVHLTCIIREYISLKTVHFHVDAHLKCISHVCIICIWIHQFKHSPSASRDHLKCIQVVSDGQKATADAIWLSRTRHWTHLTPMMLHIDTILIQVVKDGYNRLSRCFMATQSSYSWLPQTRHWAHPNGFPHYVSAYVF